MFPFVILLSGIWFFLKVKKSDEATAINVSGMSNISVISIPATVSILVGILFMTAINPITSTLVKKYESLQDEINLLKQIGPTYEGSKRINAINDAIQS